jgi:hypothetical protein
MDTLYPNILIFHSLIRWIISILFIVLIVRWYLKRNQTGKIELWDKRLINSFLIFASIQLILGFELYFRSPLVNYFLTHFSEAIHQRQPRFFGMEHSSMMLTGIIMVCVGIVKSKQKETPYKTLFIYYGIAFLIIFSSIPWEYSPLTSRPLWRWF